MDDIEYPVIAAILDATRTRKKLDLETDLFSDLGVDGIDAEKLLQRLSMQFGFSLQGLQFDRHFGPEAGFNPLALLMPGWWRRHRNRIPVRVADIVEAARTLKWPIKYDAVPEQE